ncbi:MAG: dicarboxylate/amino acid:cation symporter [Flavobacteriaceae bacterium]|nr:dicarboxylate/amino acid:cation symporter [Flavobacteriaceae bacterium]
MKKLALHWKILIGMFAGILFGISMLQVDGGDVFIQNWVKPFGTIFVKMLKLIAVPLIMASLIKGISDLKDISKFRNIGVKTIVIYIGTTIMAITIGLVLVNIIKPGDGIAQSTIDQLTSVYSNNTSISAKIQSAASQKEAGPLAFLVDMVPDNAIRAMGEKTGMLKVIFFTIFLGVSMLLIKPEKAKPFKDFFDSLNDIILKMVDVIMLTAPFAVFSLLSNVVVTANDPAILMKLLQYSGVVVLGLLIMIAFYCTIMAIYAKRSPIWFLKQIAPAQLLAFSTSSSAATLPVTMDVVENKVGVDKEITGFVLPVGATVNMDGTSLYQAVAAVFIAQALHHDLTLGDQLTIVLTALMASIGSAAVPGAGMVMLVIVLESIGFPPEKLAVGLALIFAVDRPLDMLRTTINVTGDATVATIVAKSEGKLRDMPKE